jgi:tetratricopeptide (TPR) repeat protein
MRKYIAIIFVALPIVCFPQVRKIDSLRLLISNAKEDSNKVFLLRDIGFAYYNIYIDSCYFFAIKGADLARKLHDEKNESICLSLMGTSLAAIGNVPKALEVSLKCLKLAEHTGNPTAIYEACSTLGAVYYYNKDFQRSNNYFFRCLMISSNMQDQHKIALTMASIGDSYFKMNQFDSSIYFTKLAYKKSVVANDKIEMADELNNLGDTYSRMNKGKEALEYYRLALAIEIEMADVLNRSQTNLGIANIYRELNQKDSALVYAYRTMVADTIFHIYGDLIESCNLIASVYESERNMDSAFKYLKLTIALKDSLFMREKLKAIENMNFNETIRQQEIAAEKKKAVEDHVRNLQLLAIGVFIPIFFIGVLLLSRTKVKPRVVEFLGILSLLLFFEFITDLIYPYINNLTNENPIWEMLFLVSLAGLLEPLNFKLEHWVKGHLVHKPVPVSIALTVEDGSYDVE